MRNGRRSVLGGLLGLLVFICITSVCQAQDVLPVQPLVQDTLINPDKHLQYGLFPIPGKVKQENSMPVTFRGTSPNVIERAEMLAPVFEKLRKGTEPVRVVQIGDSHVRGHIFSVVVRHTLEDAFGNRAVLPDEITYKTDALARETGAPGIVYHAIGINGATTAAFCNREMMEQVASLNPDLVILSFGTNESHVRHYDPVEHYAQLDALLSLLTHYNPGVAVLFTTPPGSYLAYRRRRRTVRVENQYTEKAVNVILDFSKRNNYPVWDLYNIAGGKRNACSNWTRNGLMQRDRVHYTVQGYTLQGKLLGEAIIKAFNDYVAN